MGKPLVLRRSFEDMFSRVGARGSDQVDIRAAGDQTNDLIPLMRFR
jgi:hypothetical protein